MQDSSETNRSVSFQFSLFEQILIASGVLFFANVVYISAGGGFALLYVAKAVYLLGIVILLFKM